MADTEDSAAAILPQEEEKERKEEEDVKSKVQASDQASADQPQENGTASEEDVEGAEPEAEQQEQEEQLVVEEEDGDRAEQQQQQQQQLGPRDEIKVTVTGYQRTADNCTYDVEVYIPVKPTTNSIHAKLSYIVCQYLLCINVCSIHKFQVEVNNGKAKTIHRTYQDLLWLHRNLTRRVELGGYIVRKL